MGCGPWQGASRLPGTRRERLELLKRWLAAFALVVFAPGGAGAVSFTLEELVESGGYTTANGVQFHDFTSRITGSLAHQIDLSQLIVTFEEDGDSAGFSLTGPISVADGATGKVDLGFQIVSAQPLVGAALESNNTADGRGSRASVSELVRGSRFNERLITFDSGASRPPVLSDSIVFAPQHQLEITKDIFVDTRRLRECEPGKGDCVRGTGTGTGSAEVTFLRQTFTLVPEPGTLGLLAAGLAALAAGRRRSRPS